MEAAGAGNGVAVQLVGRLTVVLNGARLEDKQVGSRKARTLLAILASDPSSQRDAEWLGGPLGPGQPPGAPGDNVATLVSRLLSSLGAAAVGGDRAGWRLGDVRVDVAGAARLVESAVQHLAGEPT